MALPKRDCRYQAAVVMDNHVLLLRVRDPLSNRTFWLVPGGGREDGEGEEDCVRREVREETRLDVEVERLLREEAVSGDAMYQRTKTYLCRVVSGVAGPGSEPEFDSLHIIEELAWFALDQPEMWGPAIDDSPITSQFLVRLRDELRL